MNSIRKKTALVAALVISLASLPAVSPAQAESTPVPTVTPSPVATADPTVLPAPSAPTTAAPSVLPAPSESQALVIPATTDSAPADAGAAPDPEPRVYSEEAGEDHTVAHDHTFETPLPTGNKGVTARKVSTEAYSLARAGDIKVRLVMVQLADRKATISEAAARAAINTSSEYWRAMSNQRLSMSVTAVENRTSNATSAQSYSAMMNTIAGEIGWVPSPYTALVVFVSTPTLSAGAYGAGWSYDGTSGRVLMPLPATLTDSVLSHEFGHVLGLMHANRLVCADGAVDVATNADGSFANSQCSVDEYKDNLDLMGVSQRSQPVISSPSYEFGGFGSGNEVRNLGKVSGKNGYQLRAWGGADDHRGLKFTDPISGEVYYLELRLPVGNDAATAIGGNRGVKIVQTYGAGSIALQPSSTTFTGYYSANQAWQPGQTFKTHAGTKVTIDWISESAAGVTIDALPPARPIVIAPGDFNGDGIADLIHRKSNGELWLYPGEGSGRNLPGQRIGTGWEIYDRIFGTGDFNGDGRNDLVARKFDGSLWFYAGTGRVSGGSEGYVSVVKIGEYGWEAFTALLGVRDFDGDGKPDILARRPDGVLLLYPGMGTGWPGAPRNIDYGWEIFDQLIAIQDFNGDGTNDLAARRPDGSLWLYSNTGHATLVTPRQIGTGWQIYDEIVGTGDADGDRAVDFVARQPDGSVFFYAGTVMRDEGYGDARKIGDFGWEVFNSLTATEDLNGDKIADLLARKPDGSLFFYPGNGSGAYGTPRKIGDYGWEAFNALISVGDFNGDGKNDLIARKPDGTLWLYPGTGLIDAGNPGYAAPKRIGDYGWDVFTALIGTGDFNGDGKNDLLARKADGSLWLYRGTGIVSGSNVGYSGALKIGDYGWEVFDQLVGSGDFNADGKNDLIARKFNGTLWMYPGDGTGKLSAPRRIGTGWNVFDTVLGAGKLNADSFADLVARRPDGSLWAYSGTGMQPSEGYLPRAFAAAL
ncbi:MAG TPA: FG-GAP-like repeat-containing protein [Arthrobacter sp.]|nr:FG-GAP-like repeat-containing protein [Arthrobacter sp.]